MMSGRLQLNAVARMKHTYPFTISRMRNTALIASFLSAIYTLAPTVAKAVALASPKPRAPPAFAWLWLCLQGFNLRSCKLEVHTCVPFSPMQKGKGF